jgi:hypothetical protein
MLKSVVETKILHHKDIVRAVIVVQKFVRMHQQYIRFKKEMDQRRAEMEPKLNGDNPEDDDEVDIKAIRLETFYGHSIDLQVPNFAESSDLYDFIKDRFYELEGLIPQWQVVKPDEKDKNKFYLELSYNAPKNLPKDVQEQQRKLIRSLFDMKSHLTHLRKVDFLHKLSAIKQKNLLSFVEDYNKRKESSGYYDYYEEETFLDFAKKHGYDETLVPLAEEYVRID